MSVRINLEIGHEASIRTKRTPEGFTHDWEVFVRGCDDADIHCYVEKVVFYLHETFQKPKRVIKEPPYSVKESGYAGFQMLIDIYLRNRDEPKKICFNYSLDLQNAGPRIVKVQKEKYIFTNPNEEFKYKLLKGGGTLVASSGSQDSNSNSRSDDKSAQMTSKPKMSGGDILKKHKTKIEEPRISDSFQELFGTPITKTSKISPDPQKMAKEAKKDSQQKSEKAGDKEKSKSKHSPYKEKDKEKNKDKDFEKKKEEKKKDKERNKEREKSSKHEKSPTLRGSSPKRSPKRPSSPKRPPSPPVKHKEKEDRKDGKEKEKHSAKKEKRDKEHKENRHKEKDSQKSSDKKEVKLNKKEESPVPKKDKQKEKETMVENEKLKSEKSEEKKHKHKKKDRDKKEKKGDKEKTKSVDKKVEKTPPIVQNKEPEVESKSLFESEPVIEEKTKDKLKQILPEDSSNSPISSREQSPIAQLPPPPPPIKEATPETKKNKSETEKVKAKKEKKEKKNKDKKSEKEEKKRKRKSDTIIPDEPPEKIPRDESNSDVEQNQNVAAVVNKENQENPEDYMQILRELQRKIMTLQDNSELQKVVQLIAETGRFEVSARTFDFDLCLLERSTVRQLQDFFSGTSS